MRTVDHKIRDVASKVETMREQWAQEAEDMNGERNTGLARCKGELAVSYTHLTLPTICSV
eukprot:3143668-Rhodomonas_salina.1